jgi:hypothetical protein
VALIALPVADASAQRSRATKRDPAVFADDGTIKGPTIRGRDFEDLNPFKLLLDKKKDPKLTDAQVDGYKKAEADLKAKNVALYKAVDSLARELRPPMNRTQETDDRMRDARHDLDKTIEEIHASYDAAWKDATSGFDADQQAKATELLAKFKQDGEKKVREKMRG